MNKQTKKGIERGYRTPEGVRINNYEKVGDKMQAALMEQTLHGLQLNSIQGAKHPGGRPRKYELIDDFKNAVADYFAFLSSKYNEGVELIPDIEGLCSYIGISRESFFEWERSRGAEFSDFIKEVRAAIAGYKKQLGLTNKINPTIFAIDFNNNHGYIQQAKIDITASRQYEDIPQRADILQRLGTSDPANIEG